MRRKESGFGVFLLLVLIVVLLVIAGLLSFDLGGCDAGHGILAKLGSAHLCVGAGIN